MRTVFLLVLVTCFAGAAIGAQGAAGTGDGRQGSVEVKITSPHGGWSDERVVHVEGSVSETEIKTVDICLNGVAMTTRIQGGRFNLPVVLAPGNNLIEVEAKSGKKSGRDSVCLFSRVPKRDVKVVLSWDTDRTDIDLWVKDPKEESCGYSNRSTQIGGQLDTDVTSGYGPETFTLGSAIAGPYQVQIHYYSSHGNAQTKATVDVVLFEGTPKERRQKFEAILTKTNDRYPVGVFEIRPEWVE